MRKREEVMQELNGDEGVDASTVSAVSSLLDDLERSFDTIKDLLSDVPLADAQDRIDDARDIAEREALELY